MFGNFIMTINSIDVFEMFVKPLVNYQTILYDDTLYECSCDLRSILDTISKC